MRTQQGKYLVAKEFSYTTTERSGDGWLLIGDAYGFIDPIYSSGVYLALKSADMGGRVYLRWDYAAIICPPNASARGPMNLMQGYTGSANWFILSTPREFSFGQFMKQFPHHGSNLTDLLIGRVFEGNPGAMFEDLDPWIEKVKTQAASV